MTKSLISRLGGAIMEHATESGWLERKRQSPDPWADSGWWWTTNSLMANGDDEVTEQSSMTYSAVWACVKVISEDLASLPLFVYRRGEKTKEHAKDLDIYWLLHDAPNDEMSALQFREAMQIHLLLWGNCFAEIQRNLRGQVAALWPLDPSKMTITRPAKELIYEYRLPDGGKRDFTSDEIFHVAGLSLNGLVGLSPIAYQREAVRVGLSSQQFQKTSLQSGHSLQLVFTHPSPKAPSEEGRKAFAKKIRDEFGGPNGQKIGVLWEGMTAKEISMTMADAQFVESKKLSVTEIARIFRVPPHKIMDLERATFSNIEQQSISYVIDAIRPWAVRWEQAINQQLLGNSSKFFCEHQVDGLLRGDITSRYAAYAVGRQWGWLTVNRILELENMNPVKGGDTRLEPLNMVAIDENGNKIVQQTPPPSTPDDPITDEQKEEAARMIQKLRLIRG